MSNDRRTILIRSFYSAQSEGLAAAVIQPGALVELTDATSDTVQLQATHSIKCAMNVAIEDDLQGNDIDDNYAEGAVVRYRTFLPGDRFYGRLATSQTITKGMKLESAGGGLLRELDAGQPLATAREAVTTTSAVANIAVEVL
jgi:hypothetical protein